MCRGELSAVIARVMSTFLRSGWKWWWGVKEIPPPPLPLQSCDSWMFVKENPDRKKKWQKTSCSYLIQVCQAILNNFYLKVKFWITACQNFGVLEGNYGTAKDYMLFNSSSCFSVRLFFRLKVKRLNAHQLWCWNVGLFRLIGSIASTIREFVNYIRA